MAENILGNAANAQGKEDKYSGGFLKGFVMNNLMAKSAQKSIDGGGSSSSGGVTAAQASGPTAPANVVFGGQKAMSRANENYREQLRIHREEVLNPYRENVRTDAILAGKIQRKGKKLEGKIGRKNERQTFTLKEGSADNALIRSEAAKTADFIRQQPSPAAVANNRARTTTGTTRAANVKPALPAGAKSMAAVNRQNSAASTYVTPGASGAKATRQNNAATSYITPSA